MFKKSFVRCILIVTIVAAFLIVGCSSSGATTSQPVSEQKVEAAEPQKAEVAKPTKEVTEPQKAEVTKPTEEAQPEVETKPAQSDLDSWIASLDTSGPKVLVWNTETNKGIIIESDQDYNMTDGDQIIFFDPNGLNFSEIQTSHAPDIDILKIDKKSENYGVVDIIIPEGKWCINVTINSDQSEPFKCWFCK